MAEKKKYIFITGGVMSGVGKGITCSAIAAILKGNGLKVTAIKIDPYVNVDAGTMNPTEHGEVFVLNDGMECDQDMGNYERFLDQELNGGDYMTTGSVYKTVIERERALEYKGKCVEVAYHVPMEVIDRIEKSSERHDADITIVEIGGTVGDYQNVLFLEAARMMKIRHPHDVIIGMVSYLPIPHKIGEMKTKPTQHAVRALNSTGIQPDFIIGRAENPLDDIRKEKISTLCNVSKEDVISAPDVESIYDIPVNFENDGISTMLLQKLGLKKKNKNGLKPWQDLYRKNRENKKIVKIAVVGKYFEIGEYVLSDSYISVIEAIKHAGFQNNVKVKLSWINSEEYERVPGKVQELKKYDGVVVPGGFGSRGIEGIIKAIKYVRKNKIPYLGLCYGMQLATIEYARNMAGLSKATSAEINPDSPRKVVDVMEGQKEKIKGKKMGGTMRLGAYTAVLQKNSLAAKAYEKEAISERHRHRYEINPKFIPKIEKAGLVFSGKSPDGKLMEIAELPQKVHPFFIGTQFHPEFQSYPYKAHPLFSEFIKVAKKNNRS